MSTTHNEDVHIRAGKNFHELIAEKDAEIMRLREVLKECSDLLKISSPGSGGGYGAWWNKQGFALENAHKALEGKE